MVTTALRHGLHSYFIKKAMANVAPFLLITAVYGVSAAHHLQKVIFNNAAMAYLRYSSQNVHLIILAHILNM
jgi:hypothetical protein